ncbi:hypothetical protein chiPu_0028788 [Chiloscyllium punctatum]|uniref:Uncharacterized protein n=1 Tax=Chiloscyllium punctatum TaxID=137246 RepID=A0A401TQA7_CHIPU|nr:hypothetical protein [Chiloscyllium punctatum]
MSVCVTGECDTDGKEELKQSKDTGRKSRKVIVDCTDSEDDDDDDDDDDDTEGCRDSHHQSQKAVVSNNDKSAQSLPEHSNAGNRGALFMVWVIMPQPPFPQDSTKRQELYFQLAFLRKSQRAFQPTGRTVHFHTATWEQSRMVPRKFPNVFRNNNWAVDQATFPDTLIRYSGNIDSHLSG